MSPHIEKFMSLSMEDRLTLRAAAKNGDMKKGLPMFKTYFPGLSQAEIPTLIKDIAGLPDVWFR